MARRRAKNLFLEPAVVYRAERFCELADTTLSQLVEDYLRTLPREGAVVRIRSPIVARLREAQYEYLDGGDTFSEYVSRNRERLVDRGDDY